MTDYQLRPDRDLTILIPARAGSKRVPHKNVRMLGGKPLLLWTLMAAEQVCENVIVSSDDTNVLYMAGEYLAETHLRKPEHATDDAPDFLWVNDLKERIKTPYFAICRPTSPFRTASTIRRGYAALVGSGAHSIRAVSRVTAPHPGKMWRIDGQWMRPVLDGWISTPDIHAPYHSCPTQILPEVYVQNASLEIAQTWVIAHTQTISGFGIAPFLTDPMESINIDTEADFAEAERIVTDSALR